MALAGDAFHRAILSGTRDARREVLSHFKTHVKKDNVDLSSVPRYFEALAVTMNLLDPELQSLAFSLVCHLVKRVSIQDKGGSILPEVATVVLPLVLPKIADPRNAFKISARRALEAYWLGAPSQTERAVATSGLVQSDQLLANESVVWLNSILLINTNLDLRAFFHPLAQVLSHHSNDTKLTSNVKILFANYFDLKHNRLHRFELQKALEASNVGAELRTSIVGIDSALSRDCDQLKLSARFDRDAFSVSAKSARVETETAVKTTTTSSSNPSTSILAKSTKSEASNSSLSVPTMINALKNNATSPAVPTFVSAKVGTIEPNNKTSPESASSLHYNELSTLMRSLSGSALEEGISHLGVENEEALTHIFSSAGPCFEGKETEKNWTHREKSITRVRQLLRSDARQKYPNQFLECIKDFHEAICKALMSLRTSLCLTSCQLMKELAIYLHQDFSVLFDLFWPTLLRLCSNTKHLTSTSAHVVVSSIFANTALNSKSPQKIYHSSREKSASVRAYSAFWLQIYMLRNSPLWSLPPNCEVAENILLKLLPDPNVQVRQAAKDAFWRYYILAENAAGALLSRLDVNTVKAVERSRPQNCKLSVSASPSQRSRLSIKEAIAAKNKELKSRQLLSRSGSQNGHRPSHLRIHTVLADSAEPLVNARDSMADSFLKLEMTDEHIPGTFAINEDSHLSDETKTTNSYTPPPSNTKSKDTAKEVNVVKQTLMESSVIQSKTSQFDPDTVCELLSGRGIKQIESGVLTVYEMATTQMPLPPKIHSALFAVSVSHAQLLRPLLEDRTVAPTVLSILGADDFVRTSFVAIGHDKDCLELLVSVLDYNQLFKSIESLLSLICNMDLICNNKPLVMQLIKSKATILRMLMTTLAHAVTSNSVPASSFSQVLSTLFGLVPIVYQTNIISAYELLLLKLHDYDQKDFMFQLRLASLQNQREICNLLSLEVTLKPLVEDTMTLHTDLTLLAPGTASEFTLIAPGTSSFSPLKHPSDFSMVLPTKIDCMSNPHSLSSNSEHGVTAESVKVESEPNSLVSAEHDRVAVTDTDKPSPKSPEKQSKEAGKDASMLLLPDTKVPFQNVFAKSDSKALSSEFVAKLHSDPARDLVEDFAQVNLSNFSNNIEAFIEKVDPLTKISTRNRPIAIFEDPKGGSPQKAKDYSYTDSNWFNFEVARLSLMEQTSDDLEQLCTDMSQGSLSGIQLCSLLKMIQNSRSQGLAKGGHLSRIEAALWDYFNVQTADKLVGLMVLKQLLVCRHVMPLASLWQALITTSCCVPAEYEQEYVVELALKEVFEEMMCGMFSSVDIYRAIFATFRTSTLLQGLLLFLVESLHSLSESKSLVLLMTEQLVGNVDAVLRPFVTHDSARVRKAVFKTYGLFLKACLAIDETGESCTGSSTHRCMMDVLLAMSVSERKLVEYYSDMKV